MASKAGFWARRFPKLSERWGRFQDTSTGKVTVWVVTNPRKIFLGVTASYLAVGYVSLKLKQARNDVIHPNTYLVWKFYPGSIVEVKGPPSLSYLLSKPSAGEEIPRVMDLHEAVRALKFAAADPRIRGIFGDFTTLSWPSNRDESLGLAQIEELTQAIHDFNVAKSQQFPPLSQEQSAQAFKQLTGKDLPVKKGADASSGTAEANKGSSAGSSEKVPQLTQVLTIGDKKFPVAQGVPATIAFADTFLSMGSYLLASSFEKVYLQPSGGIPLVGVSAQLPFFGRLLEKLGIKVVAEARREYKSMIAQFAEKDSLTKPQAENEAQLLGELNRSVAYAIGTSRFPELDAEAAADKVASIMCEGPFSAPEAEKLGLIDGRVYRADVLRMLGQPDEIKQTSPKKAKRAVGVEALTEQRETQNKKGLRFKALPRYYTNFSRQFRDALDDDQIMNIAVCYLRGTISSTPGLYTASACIKGLYQAAADKDISAIVVRMDSGGGDVVSSESVWHAIERVKKASGKPVIVSFGNIAASGAYYAATAADVIFASEATVTGSIGVASLRPTVTRKLFDWAGVGIQSFFTGATDSLLYDMTDDQKQRQSKHIDETYDDFLAKVMEGRKMSKDVIESIAGGRVFTGLVAWTMTNPMALEAARMANEDLTSGKGATKVVKDLVKQAEEALGFSSGKASGLSPSASHAGIKGPSAVSDQYTGTMELAEWELQDIAQPGQMSSVRVIMKPKASSSSVSNIAGSTTSSIESLASAAGIGEQTTESSSPGIDLAEAAHLDAKQSHLSSDNDPAARRAQESAKTTSPFGDGLVDHIGGFHDATQRAAHHGLGYEAQRLMRKEKGKTLVEAFNEIRPNCPRFTDEESGESSFEIDTNLIAYPKEEPALNRILKLAERGSGSDDSVSVSRGFLGWLQAEVQMLVARGLVGGLKMLADDPEFVAKEVAKGYEQRLQTMQGNQMAYGGAQYKI